MYHAGNELTVKVNLRGVNTWWRYFRIETRAHERERERENMCENGRVVACERRASSFVGSDDVPSVACFAI